MQKSNNVISSTTIWVPKTLEDLKQLGYDIFSYPIESIVNIGPEIDEEDYTYYTLYRYLRNLSKEWLIMPPPIRCERLAVTFKGVSFAFIIPVEISFQEPQTFNNSVIERIEKYWDISLCNLQYDIYETRTIVDKEWKEHYFPLYVEQYIERLEYNWESQEKKNKISDILWFKEKIKEFVNSNKEKTDQYCKQYAEVLKVIANGAVGDKETYKNSIQKIYDDEWLFDETLQKNALLVKAKKRLYSNWNKQEGKETASLLHKNQLLFNDAYKGQWAEYYKNVLKWWDYKKLYREEMEIIRNNVEKLKKYVWWLHISFGCGDMSKEVEIYKQLLGVTYMDDEDCYERLQGTHPDIQHFKKTHAYIWFDTSNAYESNNVYLKLIWTSKFFGSGDYPFFDQSNCFFSNDDISTYLEKGYIVQNGKKVYVSPWKFGSASFGIMGNTLLNFDTDQKVLLLDKFMEGLWEKTTWIIAVHQKHSEEQLLKMYNTPQERNWLKNLIKAKYWVLEIVEGKKQYTLDFSMSQEWHVHIRMILNNTVTFHVSGKEITKEKGTILDIGISEKSSDKEFEDLITKTKNVKILDTLGTENGWVKLYIVGNKHYTFPEEWLHSFDTKFNENYLQWVQDEKSKVAYIVSKWKAKDFSPRYNEFWIEQDLKNWEVQLLWQQYFNPENRKWYVTLKIKFDRSFEKIEELLDVVDTLPNMIERQFVDTESHQSSRATCNLNWDKYTLWIDNRKKPYIWKKQIDIEAPLQDSMVKLSKSILLEIVQKYAV